MAKHRAKEAPENAKAAPMTYEAVRAPNLRERLRSEARRSEEGPVEIDPASLTTEKEG